jgi:spermidine synthase
VAIKSLSRLRLSLTSNAESGTFNGALNYLEAATAVNDVSFPNTAIFQIPMKPRIKRGAARTPDGGEMVLFQHDQDFSIMVNGQELMHSRRHESELELARLGCAHLAGRREPCILIGGLGMGYTLRQTLDLVGPQARVVVAELLPAVVEWNREFLGELNNQSLQDERVELVTGDVVELISASRSRFDAILLDIDNGPSAMTDAGNNRLYTYEGILACRCALRDHGCLALWSAGPSKRFEELLTGCGFHVRRFRAAAYKGSESLSHFIWVASPDKMLLPPGGGEPRLPTRGNSKHHRRPRR